MQCQNTLNRTISIFFLQAFGFGVAEDVVVVDVVVVVGIDVVVKGTEFVMTSNVVVDALVEDVVVVVGDFFLFPPFLPFLFPLDPF